MKHLTILLLLFALFLNSCNSSIKDATKENSKDKLTQIVLQELIKAHGGEKYQSADYSFTFRNKSYRFQEGKSGSQYFLTYKKDGKEIKETLTNGKFERWVDGQKLELSSDEQLRFSGGINSVIYFATLPYRLLDPSVNVILVGETQIKGEGYQVLSVSFDKEGGGQDHDDQYMYWVNKASHQLDYLAYNYSVNKGGVRFRSAFNKRKVGGIVFQDYINYKADVGTPLEDLPQLYEKGILKELSKILTEDVVNNEEAN